MDTGTDMGRGLQVSDMEWDIDTGIDTGIGNCRVRQESGIDIGIGIGSRKDLGIRRGKYRATDTDIRSYRDSGMYSPALELNSFHNQS